MSRLLPPSGPGRTLSIAQLTNAVGDGTFLVCSALYFARIVGLSPAQIGVGLTVGWAVGAVAGVPFGHLADQRGPRGVTIALAVATGLSVAVFLGVRSFGPFVVACCGYAVCQSGLAAALQALLAGMVSDDQRTEMRAYLQSMRNAGLGIGAGVGGVALYADTRTAYLVAFGIDALAFLVSAPLLLRLPSMPASPGSAPASSAATVSAASAASTSAPSTAPASAPSAASTSAPSAASASPSSAASASVGSAAPDSVRSRSGGRGHGLEVLKDRPYALISLLNTVLLLRMPLISLALPLWIVQRTAAPSWMVSALFVLNTVCVVLFQVRLARLVGSIPSALRWVRRSGYVMLAACAVFAVSHQGSSGWIAGAVLVVASILLVAGEMLQSAGTWEIGFDLAPADRQGQYQGFFGSGVIIARMVGPALLTTLLLGWGTAGWLVLGAGFLVTSYAMVPAVRWAEKRRTAAVLTAVAPAAHP